MNYIILKQQASCITSLYSYSSVSHLVHTFPCTHSYPRSVRGCLVLLFAPRGVSTDHHD